MSNLFHIQVVIKSTLNQKALIIAVVNQTMVQFMETFLIDLSPNKGYCNEIGFKACFSVCIMTSVLCGC